MGSVTYNVVILLLYLNMSISSTTVCLVDICIFVHLAKRDHVLFIMLHFTSRHQVYAGVHNRVSWTQIKKNKVLADELQMREECALDGTPAPEMFCSHSPQDQHRKLKCSICCSHLPLHAHTHPHIECVLLSSCRFIKTEEGYIAFATGLSSTELMSLFGRMGQTSYSMNANCL